eukprot:5384985-Pyramimonas_sp.AAC.1
MRRRALEKGGRQSMKVLMGLRVSAAQSTPYLFVEDTFELRTSIRRPPMFTVSGRLVSGGR